MGDNPPKGSPNLMPLKTPKPGRLTQLDGLRAVAIGAVFLHHAFHLPLLWMGVDLFFILSGFLITGILYGAKGQPFKDYIGHFYSRRVRRIIPPYAVVLLISAVLFGTSWLHYWYLYIGGMNFLEPLHLPHLDTLPLWSLAVEEQFYVFWPLAVLFLSRRRLIQLSAALVVLTPILRFVCTPLFSSHWAVYMLLPFRMDTLAAGALIALIWPSVRDSLESTRTLRRTLYAVSLGVAAAGVVGLFVLGRLGYATSGNTRIGNTLIYELALIISSAAFVLALTGFAKSFLTIAPMVWIGRISYSIYLIHQTAILLLPGHYEVPALAATLGYAALMWVFVEAPILGQTTLTFPKRLGIKTARSV